MSRSLTAPRLVALVLASLTSALEADEPLRFVTRQGDKLYDGDQEFRFVSWNIPNLHNVEDAFEFLGETAWRWPDAFEVNDALESVRQMGGQVARTYVLSVRRPDGDMGQNVHVTGPGEFNEEAFRTLDLVLKVANEKGVRIIVPLVDNWQWWGGIRQYEAFRGKPEGSFWSDPEVIEDFKRTVEFVVTRRNTLTGVRYADDPAILGWETGNELDATPEWTRQIAAYLKRLDPNHLVIDGRSLHGVTPESLEDPNVDVLTTHHYPNTGNNTAQSVIDAVTAIGGKKAYFVGEFGFLPVDEAQRLLDAVIDRGVSGALYWSLRFHRREGGFYWHHEPAGGDLFKAYHWPGFPEGREYREHLVMPMVRNAAYKVRGLQTPPPPRPAPPTLLLPAHPRQLSWRGSAGAASYDVQRALNEDGPWSTIARDLSDAAYPYRPLFVDEQAPPGTAHFYRVVAKNESGASPPSDAIGPLIDDSRLLADELLDLSRIDSIDGDAQLATGDARRTQEDFHRLRLKRGATATYRFKQDASAVRVWSFGEGSGEVAVEVAGEAGAFRPAMVRHQSPRARANDYGYLVPTLSKARGLAPGVRRIRIVSTPTKSAAVELSRVEVEWGR